ncbi:pyrroline-5-carboxylate reductase [Aquamicrobium ahrensii]|uniref:Pyrroline-5-carboxylate reductase n=1 Tax=Aquamicrobium ahrensii TaxID=469551 RepID=A0ABV2KLZ7_9HYPH
MTARLVLVGCGHMGHAMLTGWINAGRIAANEIVVVEPNDDLRDRAATLGCAVASDADGLPADISPEIVVIAVKPQVIREVLADYARFGDGAATFVSIAAGSSVATFEGLLGEDTPVIRCMPNIPAAIGKGMMVVFANDRVSEKARDFVAGLLSASGEVASIGDEKLMDAVTAVSGSGPGYVFHFIEALTAAARTAGLPAETAARLAVQTVYGAAVMAAESGEEPGALRQQVTSYKGTTAAALDVLMGEERLTRLLTEAVEAARKRSIELGS